MPDLIGRGGWYLHLSGRLTLRQSRAWPLLVVADQQVSIGIFVSCTYPLKSFIDPVH
jgi:hypothetical protein